MTYFTSTKTGGHSIPFKILGSCQPTIAIDVLQLSVILQLDFPHTLFLIMGGKLGGPMADNILSS